MRVLLKLVLACGVAVVLHGLVTANVTYEAVFAVRCGMVGINDLAAVNALVEDYQRHYGRPLGVPADVAAASVARAEAEMAEAQDAAAAAAPAVSVHTTSGGGGGDTQHDHGGACCDPDADCG